MVGVDLGSICHRKTEWDPYFFFIMSAAVLSEEFFVVIIFSNKKNNLFSAHLSI